MKTIKYVSLNTLVLLLAILAILFWLKYSDCSSFLCINELIHAYINMMGFLFVLLAMNIFILKPKNKIIKRCMIFFTRCFTYPYDFLFYCINGPCSLIVDFFLIPVRPSLPNSIVKVS